MSVALELYEPNYVPSFVEDDTTADDNHLKEPSEKSVQQHDDEGFQKVLNRKNKGKNLAQQMVCSLPSINNPMFN